MNCNEALPLLDPLADGALDTRDATLVLAHIKQCTACQTEWYAIESLQQRFKQANAQEIDASQVLNKVRAAIKNERAPRTPVFNAVSVAAVLVLFIGVAEFSAPGWLTVPKQQVTVAQADQLVDSLPANINATPVRKDRLPQLLGYSPVYLPLTDWHMDGARVARDNSAGIAMFAFSRENEQMVCYQSLAGTIGHANTQLVAVGEMNVHVGRRGDYNYALWSNNGRDYLLVSKIAREKLLDTIGKTAA